MSSAHDFYTKLADAYDEATQFDSSPTAMQHHPEFAALVEQGERYAPWIISDFREPVPLRRGGLAWLLVLDAIVPERERPSFAWCRAGVIGDREAAWLQWNEERKAAELRETVMTRVERGGSVCRFCKNPMSTASASPSECFAEAHDCCAVEAGMMPSVRTNIPWQPTSSTPKRS